MYTLPSRGVSCFGKPDISTATEAAAASQDVGHIFCGTYNICSYLFLCIRYHHVVFLVLASLTFLPRLKRLPRCRMWATYFVGHTISVLICSYVYVTITWCFLFWQA